MNDSPGKPEHMDEEEARFYSEIMNNLSEGVCLTSLDNLTIVYTNPKFEQMFGYEPGELSHKNVLVLNASAERSAEEQRDKISAALAASGEWQGEVKNVKKDGATFYCYATVSVFHHSRYGRVAISVHSDLTERKRAERDRLKAEQELQQSKLLAETIMNSIPARVFWKDRNGVFLGCNQAVAQDAGLKDPNDLIGKTDYDMPWREQADRYVADDREVMESGCPKMLIEEPQQGPDGSTITLLTSKTPLHNSNGEIIGILGAYLDISERKKAEEALRSSQERTRTILQTAMDGFWLGSSDGVILEVNEAYCRMSGYSREEIIGKRITDLDATESPAETAARIGRIIAEGEERFETKQRRKDGSIFDVEVSVQYQKAEGGRMVVFLRDITLRKQAEETINRQLEELKIAKAQAEESVRLKTEFLSNMSHEIRTPMNAVLGMADLLRDTPLSEEQRDYLETINQSGHLLLGIINDILDLSKIEAGKVELERLPFDLRELVALLGSLAISKLKEKSLEWVVNIAPEIPPRLIGDSLRLQQVLMNLISNAIKFTPEKGTVMLDISMASFDASQVAIEFSVIDNGIGIPKEKHELIFGAFTQADGSTTREHGGTGLGLTIAERLVRLMGGELGVKSRPGTGSVFHFSCVFPIALREIASSGTPPSTGVAPVSVRPLRILVAEDNAANQMVLARFLEKAGHSVALATDGNQAIECYRQAEFDIILMDIQMPEKNGFQAAAEIKALGTTLKRRKVPIIAVTAHALEGDREKCLSLGMDGYLSKPIDRKELMSTIAQFVE